MTSKLNKHNKSKLILVLLMVSVLCLSLFSVACNKDSDDSNKTVPSFSYTQTDDGDISNPTFSYGTLDTKLENFPKTSVTGWSRSKDANTNITQSSAKSGVINVSKDGYDELVNALYKDTYIRDFVKGETDKTEEADVKAEIKTLFPNPAREGAKDDFVYMLNNYRTSTYLGIGTAQKITSSSEITLNKGEYGKITVWVKTANLSAANDDFGANIRIINKFNGSEQAEYAITNIVADEWTQYTIYVKADDNFNTSIKVALGLGYDINGITQGTAYFDDVTFEHVTAENFTATTATVNKFEYNGEDKIIIENELVSVLDLSFNANSFFSVDNNVSVSLSETVSNTGKDGLPFKEDTENKSKIEEKAYTEALPFAGATVKKVELKNASATLKFTSDKFSVAAEGYVYLAFYVKNQLDKFGSQSITFDVVEGDVKTTPAVASITTADEEWQKVTIVVKNNFADSANKKFSINVVIGPADVVSAKYTYEYATGEVLISYPVLASGSTVVPVEDDFANEDDFNKAKVNYDLYSLISSTAKGSTALYAGYSSDYTDSSDTETYTLTTAPSDIGTILSKPASVKGYQGIIAEHSYISDKYSETAVNSNKNAGLINTKYLNEYGIDGLKEALDFTATDDVKSIQPIMIYNNDYSSYGYIGEPKTISASAYAKISVNLRVVDEAKAYIYLVNVNDEIDTDVSEKGILKLRDKQLALEITKDDMNYDGWVTVEFYVAAGASAIDFRVEMWNGSRDNVNKSKGFVFIKEVNVSTSSAFTETSGVNDIYNNTNPLGAKVEENNGVISETFATNELITFTRELTETEKQFNKEYSLDKNVEQVKYSENYIWAKNNTMVYAIYNTIDPVEVDPYASITDEEETSEGCTAETDPSTFWLSFSSILLGVVLVIAIIMLFIKNIRRRRKANASDAKSHYTVTSRTKAKKNADSAKKAPAKKEVIDDVAEDVEETTEVEEVVETEEVIEDVSEEVVEEVTDETENAEVTDEVVEEPKELTQEEKDKQVLDSYVYGEVQIFGEEKDENKN